MPGLRKTEAGVVVFEDRETGAKILEIGTLQCVHCGGHWWPQPGSGRIRGFCSRCAGPICGPDCAECIPTELLLENMEKGRDINFRPIVVSTSFTS